MAWKLIRLPGSAHLNASAWLGSSDPAFANYDYQVGILPPRRQNISLPIANPVFHVQTCVSVSRIDARPHHIALWGLDIHKMRALEDYRQVRALLRLVLRGENAWRQDQKQRDEFPGPHSNAPYKSRVARGIPAIQFAAVETRLR